MNPALQQLKDIHLPPAISQWPIAPGWIILYLLAIFALVYVCYYYYQRYRKKYTVKFALARLTKLQQLAVNNTDNINIAAEISTLIRRTALHYFHREEIAGLAGNAWLDFLNRSGKTHKFTQEIGGLLTEVPYQKEVSTDLNPLFNITRTWLITIGKKTSC